MSKVNTVRNTRRALKPDRKSTRLNSSHLVISYAVFCLKKKKQHRDASRIRQRAKHVLHQPIRFLECVLSVYLLDLGFVYLADHLFQPTAVSFHPIDAAD